MVPPEPPGPDFEIVSIEPYLPIVLQTDDPLIITFNGDVHEHFITLGEKLYINGIASINDPGGLLSWEFTDLPDSPLVEAVPDVGSTVLEIYPPGVEIPVESVSLSPT